MKSVFESERIRFVEVSEALIPDYLLMVNDYENVGRFIGGSMRRFTAEQEREWVLQKRGEGALVFSMLEKDGGAFLGNIELMDVSDGEAELGIALTAKKQNMGYGTEAIRALTAYAAQTLGLRRIFLRTRLFNDRAQHVYRTCGFVPCGRTDTHLVMERTV